MKRVSVAGSSDRLSLPPRLATDTIYLIIARLHRFDQLIPQLGRHLSSADTLRAERFVREEDRRRHLLGRGLVRVAVGAVMDCPPSAIEFETTPEGKPMVRGGPSFNLSHSGDVVAVALAESGRLGVDVEHMRDLRDLTALARTTFRTDELGALMAMPETSRFEAFYRIWTRKEAVLKALGHGLSQLSAISVFAEAGPPGLAAIELADERLSSWNLYSMEADSSHPLAVAWDRPISTLAVISP